MKIVSVLFVGISSVIFSSVGGYAAETCSVKLDGCKTTDKVKMNEMRREIKKAGCGKEAIEECNKLSNNEKGLTYKINDKLGLDQD